MAFTYLGDLSTPLDQTRFLIGDTDSTSPLFMDGEVTGNLTLYGSPLAAAIALATAQAMKYGRKVTMSVDGLSVNYSDLSKQFIALAQQLRLQQSTSPGVFGTPYVGGVSISEMLTNDLDPDRVPSQFEVGSEDDPGSGVSGGSFVGPDYPDDPFAGL
jgi:hypothetical protein